MNFSDISCGRCTESRPRSTRRVDAAVRCVVLLLSLGAAHVWADEPPQIYFVPDVVDQFDKLNQRPDALAFALGDSPSPHIGKHYQGIVRKTGPGTPYMFLSRSGNDVPECINCGDDPGNVLVVRMGSRDTTGERLRSNRLVRDWEIAGVTRFGAINIWPTPPDPRDGVVTTIFFNGQNGWPNYGHAGGMQLLGDVLVVPLSHRYDDSLSENLIVFIDVSNPEVPVKLSEFPPDASAAFEGGQVAVTPVLNASGPGLRYLLLVAGKDNDEVRLYRSRSTTGHENGPTDLKAGNLCWDLLRSWTGAEMRDPEVGDTWPTEGSQSHQMFNFVRQQSLTGPLFLIATRNTESVLGLGDGSDLIYLYSVHVDAHGNPADDLVTFLAIKGVATESIGGGGDTSHFTGSTGVYVSPSGELILYASQHNNEGPFELTPSGDPGRRTVRFGEWRHVDMVRPDSPTLKPSVETTGPYEVDEGSSIVLTAHGRGPITKAWVQLYEHTGAGLTDNFEDYPTWLVSDYEDWDKDDFDDFVELLWYFNDKASSLRWFAHQGCSISANDHSMDDPNFPGAKTITLTGAGALPNLSAVHPVPDKSMNDTISSVQFSGGCTTYYNEPIDVAWDLNADGSFETPGETATFAAAQVDGPALQHVPVQARHPLDTTELGRGSAFVDVLVRNVPPTVAGFALTDPRGLEVGVAVPFALVHVPYTAQATFSDPGALDHQTASLAWGDGVSEISPQFDAFIDAFGGAVGRLAHRHRYSVPGTFAVELTVTDDDAGATSRLVSVKVLTPDQALGAIIETLDGLIATASSSSLRAILERARRQLAGNRQGGAANGALDMLTKGDRQATIVKLRLAIDELRAALAAGADVSALIALLEQVVASVEAI